MSEQREDESYEEWFERMLKKFRKELEYIAKNMSDEDRQWMEEVRKGWKPVSYTHLDVYKRQV